MDGTEPDFSLFLSFFEGWNNSECDRPSLNPFIFRRKFFATSNIYKYAQFHVIETVGISNGNRIPLLAKEGLDIILNK